MNRIENTEMQTALMPVQELSGVGATNGTGIPIAQLLDVGKIVLMAESVSGAGRTLNVKIQHSDVLGSGYADLSPAVAFTEVGLTDAEQAINLYLDGAKGFIRVVATLAGTSPIYRVGVALIAK